MGAKTATKNPGHAKGSSCTATEAPHLPPAPPTLADLVPPATSNSKAQLKVFEQYALGSPDITLADVKRFAKTLKVALEDPLCPPPSGVIEILNRQTTIQRLGDISEGLDSGLVRFQITGHSEKAAKANDSNLCRELTDGLPDVSALLLRYNQKKILDSGVLLSLAQQLAPLIKLVEKVHVPTNDLDSKRARNDSALDPFRERYPAVGEQIGILLAYIPNYNGLCDRLAERLAVIPVKLASFHLPDMLKALKALARELPEAQRVIAATLKKRS